MRETVALELSFVNSNLQLLKEQLAELNSSVEVYQNGTGEEPEIPMIPLGLKETKEIDFREPFKVRTRLGMLSIPTLQVKAIDRTMLSNAKQC